ncbi:phage minor capsid protein [Streptomyces sp. NBC_01016]|uniref:phage minor capsid protein n=1 Tax=Streptomyces sp. NBC_01016 TaxID=2903720 RepID=UPI00225201DF|nr:phage minor capsid protein [Streptomyces sp. NBC_01016]MCX4827179.1 phage minor capsid protein [Streptomyces sp. NBC_01016]MCX4832332.1 phage minor capsid protein [Streptomyces sp. NBC_01016]
MPVSPWMAEDLSAGVRDLYAAAEERLLAMVARRLADGIDAPHWMEAKLADIQALRRGAQAVVDELGKATSLEIHDAVAEAYNVGARAGILELGALHDDDARRIAEETPGTRRVDRLAIEANELVTASHRGILRGVEDVYRQVIAQSAATPLMGVDTRRQATQQAVQRFTDRGIASFMDRAGRSWSMPTYAEMATRTAVGRAAVEAHADQLTAAGVDLVIVSNSPHECPLCRPWEGKILALSGPSGRRTVEVEHATEDGRMVRVDVAGTVDEARMAGLQHPNCRHTVGAYLPGLTVPPKDAATDPDGYEATQRQREIERHIRKYKLRAASAVDPAAKRAAQARVRGWQKSMREHLDNHPELMRKRYREQPGASNLSTGTRPPQDAIEAARLRAGDTRTPAEMSDTQLGQAMRSGALDDRAFARVRDEADRRDHAALLARIRPLGRLVDDLTGFADDELGRALRDMGPDEALRIAAELDRRDLDTGMPGIDTTLVGMSDEALGLRAATASGDQLSAIAAEADRRQMLAAMFPAGQLAADLAPFGDDMLGWAMRYADERAAARIAAELDRRYPPEPAPAAAGAHTVEGQLADRAALDEALGPLGDVDDWSHLVDDLPDPYAGMTATERWIAEREAEQQTARGAYTRKQIREMYDEHVWAQYMAAEDATNGYLLSREAKAAGIDPGSLFTGPSHVAYARASEDLKRWWADNPRTTLAEYTEMVTGQASDAASTARKARSDQQNRL